MPSGRSMTLVKPKWITVPVEDDSIKALDAIKNRIGRVSRSHLIRLAIDEFIQRQGVSLGGPELVIVDEEQE